MASINVGIPKKKISSSVSIVVFIAKKFLWCWFFHKMLKNTFKFDIKLHHVSSEYMAEISQKIF